MNPRFYVVNLPVILALLGAAIFFYVLTQLNGISANPENTVYLLTGTVVILFLAALLAALMAHREFRTRDRENLLLRRRLETAERRMHLEESQSLVMNRVNDLHETFSVSRNLNAVLNQSVSALKDILRVKTLVLQLYSDEESRFFMRIEEGGEDIDLGEELTMEVIEDGRSRLINNLFQYPKYKALTDSGYTSLVVAPLSRIETGGKRRSIGLIAALSQERRDFTGYELDLLSTFSSQAALLIENARLYKRVEELAIRDGMTNLFNYRHFQSVLESELQKAFKSGFPLALIIFDIDDFKKYNDAFGHPEGDEVLRRVADILLDNTRGRDTVARYGGEEFVIILPETSRGGAMTVAQIIREKVESYPFGSQNPAHPPVRMSITAGLAVFPDDAKSAKELIAAADAALYRGKNSGKNRVVTAAIMT